MAHPFLKPQNLGIFTFLLLISSWQLSHRFLNRYLYWWLPQTNTEINISSQIIHQLRHVSQLNTVIFTTESLIPTTAERTLGTFVVGRTELVYLAIGEVRAGIDLKQLKPDDVQQSETGLEISLPPPQILDSKIDVGRSQVYHYDRGFLSLGPDIAPELQSLAQRQALSKIVATACQQGILEQANQQTQAIITQFLKGLGYDKFTIKTQVSTTFDCVSASYNR